MRCGYLPFAGAKIYADAIIFAISNPGPLFFVHPLKTPEVSAKVSFSFHEKTVVYAPVWYIPVGSRAITMYR